MLPTGYVLTEDLITIPAPLTRDGTATPRLEFGTDLHPVIMTTCHLLLHMEEPN